VSTFPALLTHYRRRARLGLNDLGRRTCYDNSFISRLESAYREPIRTTVVDLGHALNLAEAERDALLVAAGYAPDWLAAVPNLEALRVLTQHPRAVADTFEALGLPLPERPREVAHVS